MLQHGAAQVLAIDTGYGQIAQKLRDDPRVTLMERTNARQSSRMICLSGITFLAWMFLSSQPLLSCLL